MADIQNGSKAFVFHNPNITLKAGTTASAAGAATATSVVLANITQRFEGKQIVTPDYNGQTVNVTTYDQTRKLSLVCAPYGSSASAAKDNNLMPTPGQVVMVITADSGTYDDTDVGATSTGLAYMVDSATKTSAPGEKLTYTLELTRYVEMSSHDQV